MSWKCPKCGKAFRNTNQAHSCYVVTVDDHLKNKSAEVQAIVEKLLNAVAKFGDVTLNPVKSSIQVKAGATFLSIKPKKESVEIEFQLDEEIVQYPIYKYFRVSKNRVLHFASLEKKSDINKTLLSLLKKSYVLINNT